MTLPHILVIPLIFLFLFGEIYVPIRANLKDPNLKVGFVKKMLTDTPTKKNSNKLLCSFMQVCDTIFFLDRPWQDSLSVHNLFWITGIHLMFDDREENLLQLLTWGLRA